MAEITRDTTGNKIGTGTGGIELAPASTEPVTINNGVMLPDGSLGEPSVRFSDDTNCGVLSLTNDQINMAAHGVELTRFTGVASAVNYLELKNSITTADLSIGAVGTDTNISINLIPKGSGTLKVGGTNVALVGANLSTFTNDSGFITGFTETNDLTAAVTWANIPDANVPQTAVTQHQAALFITESQISDLGSYLTDVVGDTTPQLGGNLDVQANSITTSTVNGGITLTPNGTGDVTLGNFVFDADQTIGAGQDDYVLTYDNASGKISLEAAGGGGLANVVEDTTPQLGGNLDVQANSITTSTVNGGITLTPNGTGNVTLGTMVFDADQTIGAGQDNYVLTYDNAAGVISLEAAAGGGATGYHYAGTVTTAPVGTGEDSIVIGDASSVLNAGNNSIAIGKSAVVDTHDSIAIGVNSFVDISSLVSTSHIAIGANAKFGPTNSGKGGIAIGHYAHCQGSGGIAIGGTSSSWYAQCVASSIAIGPNSKANFSSTVAIGESAEVLQINGVALGQGASDFGHGTAIGSGAKTYSYYSVAIGKQAEAGAASKNYAVAVGNGADAKGTGAVALGTFAEANVDYGIALGYASYSKAVGSTAFGNYAQSNFATEHAWGCGRFSANGDAQKVDYLLRAQTTDATPTTLKGDRNSTTTPAEFAKLSSGFAYAFDGLVVGRRTDVAGDVAGYKIEGLIFNNAGTVSLVGTPTVTVLGESQAAWDVTVTADDTNDSLDIQVTGEASKTIRWFCNLRMVKV